MNRKELEMIHPTVITCLDEAYVEDGVAIGRYKNKGMNFYRLSLGNQ